MSTVGTWTHQAASCTGHRPLYIRGHPIDIPLVAAIHPSSLYTADKASQAKDERLGSSSLDGSRVLAGYLLVHAIDGWRLPLHPHPFQSWPSLLLYEYCTILPRQYRPSPSPSNQWTSEDGVQSAECGSGLPSMHPSWLGGKKNQEEEERRGGQYGVTEYQDDDRAAVETGALHPVERCCCSFTAILPSASGWSRTCKTVS